MRGRDLAMIFQEPMSALNPVMSVGEQIDEAIALSAPRGEVRARRERALAEVGIDPARAGDYPHQFSGGMRQRVLIAMALARSPTLLIADEPTTALDASLREQVLGLIGDLRARRGLAVLLISHDLPLVSRHADDLVVMYAGRVMESGPARAVLASPAHPYTRALLRCLPSLGTRGAALPTVQQRLADPAEFAPLPGGGTPWWPGRGEPAGPAEVSPGHGVIVVG
jgi:ABC-type dipeptide/oligopeptide/nickel transport system ATPase component